MGTAEEKSHKTIDDKTIDEIFSEMEQAIADPQKTFEKYRSANQKAIGCIPYFAPYELVDAAGMYPLELWGGDTEISRANGYYPAFYCSILVTLMERALRGEYDYLSGVIIPTTCDGLRNLEENWKFACPNSKVMDFVQPAVRNTVEAQNYLVKQLKKLAACLEDISGNELTERSLRESIALYNSQRKVMRDFSVIASEHVDIVKPQVRRMVYAAARNMPVENHISLVKQLNKELSMLPVYQHEGMKVVLTGILVDSPFLLKELEKNNIAVINDLTVAESVRFNVDVPGRIDPFVSIAEYWSRIEGASIALDPKKSRGNILINLVKSHDADGVIACIVKFCEAEEFDVPVLKKQLSSENIPLLVLDIESQNVSNEQIATRIEAFSEMVGMS